MSELQRLRDRVEELEAIIGMGSDIVQSIREVLDVKTKQARLLSVLLNQRSTSKDVIFTAVYGDLPEYQQPEIKILDVYVSHLRAKLRPHDIRIRTLWGTGWVMDPPDKAKLRSLLEVDA